MTEHRGLPRSIVITSKPVSKDSWWAVAKTRDEFYALWKQRVPHMKLTKATAFTSVSGVDLAE